MEDKRSRLGVFAWVQPEKELCSGRVPIATTDRVGERCINLSSSFPTARFLWRSGCLCDCGLLRAACVFLCAVRGVVHVRACLVLARGGRRDRYTGAVVRLCQLAVRRKAILARPVWERKGQRAAL